MRKDFWYVGGLMLMCYAAVIAAAYLMSPMPKVEAQSLVKSYPSWTCSVDNVAAALAQCGNFPKPDESFYVSWVVAQSTTATGGQFLIQYGTGTACATGTTSLLPSSAAVIRLSAAANTGAPTMILMDPPLKVPAGKALCVLGKATDTTTLQMGGPVGP